MRLTKSTLLALAASLALIVSDASAQLKPNAKIVAQPDAPITINTYSARYEQRSQYTQEGIQHELQYASKSDKTIVAIQFGLIAFDIWNEFLDRTAGITMDQMVAGKPRTGRWVATAYSAFSFHTGVAYVNRVRFDDGTIWTADQAAILAELRKIESGFDERRLKSETPPPKS